MIKKKLALDIGERRIGVAVSDGLGLMAHPLITLFWEGIENLIADLEKLIAEHDADCIVVGIPYTLKGTLSKKTEEILEIVNQLKGRLSINIETVDERLTTRMAERSLHAMNKKPSKQRNRIDQIAAVYILQTYLDQNRI